MFGHFSPLNERNNEENEQDLHFIGEPLSWGNMDENKEVIFLPFIGEIWMKNKLGKCITLNSLPFILPLTLMKFYIERPIYPSALCFYKNYKLIF